MIKWFNILLHTRNCSQVVCKFVYFTMTKCWISYMMLGFSKFTKFYYHQFLCCIYLSKVRASNCSTQMTFLQSWILYQNLRIFAKLHLIDFYSLLLTTFYLHLHSGQTSSFRIWLLTPTFLNLLMSQHYKLRVD